MSPEPNTDLSDRVRRLEEHVGFCQHETEQLCAQIAAMDRRLMAVSTTLERLQRRLDQPEPGEK